MNNKEFIKSFIENPLLENYFNNLHINNSTLYSYNEVIGGFHTNSSTFYIIKRSLGITTSKHISLYEKCLIENDTPYIVATTLNIYFCWRAKHDSPKD